MNPRTGEYVVLRANGAIDRNLGLDYDLAIAWATSQATIGRTVAAVGRIDSHGDVVRLLIVCHPDVRVVS